MNKRQHILAIMFSFFMSFFLFLGLLVINAKITLLSQNYFMHSLQKCDYYQGIATAFNNDLMQGAGAAGFESKIFENFVTVQDVQKISENYINEYFEKGISQIQTDKFKTKLDTYLHQVIKDTNMQLTTDDEKRLTAYIDINVEGYRQYLSFPFLQYFIMGFEMMDKVIPFVITACFVIVLLAFYFFTRLKCSPKEKTLYYSTTLFGTAFMLFVPAIFIFAGQYIRRVNLTPEFYYQFFVNYLEGYFGVLLICSFMLFILGFLYILIQKRKQLKDLKRKGFL